MKRYLGIFLAGVILASLAVQGCNVSPIPLPLPHSDAGAADMMTKSDVSPSKDGGSSPDKSAPDVTTGPDAKPDDGATDGATDGITDGLMDGMDGSPGDAEVDIKSPEASVADLCGEC